MPTRFFPPGTDAYSRAVDGLRRSIGRLRETGWDEELRRRALERAAELATLPRPGKTRAICRAIVALLAIRDADLRALIGERLSELIDRLPRAGCA